MNLRLAPFLLLGALVLALAACGLTVRPQPSGPDGQYPAVRQALAGVAEAPLSLRMAGSDKARLEALLARAQRMKPAAPELVALLARYERLETLAQAKEERLLEERRRGREAAASKLPASFVNSAGITMRLIPAGTFQMGSPDSEPGHESKESPVHTVELTDPFYMGVYEVTGKQWARVMGGSGGPGPKVWVSWNEASEFCRALSEKEGIVYRLPTEAEWEYACRAGSRTAYSWGDSWSDAERAKPNAFGLYDMHGNAYEWCGDWYAEGYDAAAAKNPQGPSTGQSRVHRSTSMFFNPPFHRSASRDWSYPSSSYDDLGFRVVCVSRTRN